MGVPVGYTVQPIFREPSTLRLEEFDPQPRQNPLHLGFWIFSSCQNFQSHPMSSPYTQLVDRCFVYLFEHGNRQQVVNIQDSHRALRDGIVLDNPREDKKTMEKHNF